MPEPGATRRPYARPEIVRVDLVEDEIALANCKLAQPNQLGKGTKNLPCASKNCKQNGAS